jgi:sugar-phosphatase
MVSCETHDSQERDAIAVAIAGVAGSGKTTLGHALARSFSLALLDLDSLTNPLLDELNEPVLGAHWLSSPHAQAIRDGRYAALREAAKDVVHTAGGVVLVAPFTSELQGGPTWDLLRDAVHPARLHVVQIVGDDELFAARRGARGAARDLHRRPDPIPSRPAIPVTLVDADLTTGQQVVRVRVALGCRAPLDTANAVFKNQYDAVLFDLDGTLVDSTASVTRSWRRFAAEVGVSMQALHDNHGQPARTLVEKLLPRGQVDAGVERITSLEVADAAGVRANVGAARLLQSLPDAQRAIVTSGSMAIASARMAAAGLARPAVIVTSDDVERGKPDPAPFLLAAERLGVDPKRCLVVEDAAAGIRSARAAGCEVLAVAGTVPAIDLSEATLVVDALDQVEIRTEGTILHFANRLLPLSVRGTSQKERRTRRYGGWAGASYM